jgi:ribosomal protein S18 acetylase RimI-like enzyme
MTTPTLETIITPDQDRAVAALVAAFAADPAVRWMYPRAQQYREHFPEFVAALGGKAFTYDTVDELNGSACAAFWLPPGVQPDEGAIVDLLLRSVGKDRQPEMFSILEQMGEYHPEEPHWYLPFIGVAPEVQGRGLGSALLRRGLARCDHEGVPAYLESTNPRNVPFYERFGFKAIGLIQTRTSPHIVAMVRAAR